MAELPVSGTQDQPRQFHGQIGHRRRSMQSKCRPMICSDCSYNCGSTIIRAVKALSHSRNEAILIARLSLSKSFPTIKISIGLNPRTRLSRFPARSASIFSPVRKHPPIHGIAKVQLHALHSDVISLESS